MVQCYFMRRFFNILETATVSFGVSLQIQLQLLWYDFWWVLLYFESCILRFCCCCYCFYSSLSVHGETFSPIRFAVARLRSAQTSHTLFEKTKWSKRACLEAHYNVWLLHFLLLLLLLLLLSCLCRALDKLLRLTRRQPQQQLEIFKDKRLWKLRPKRVTI